MSKYKNKISDLAIVLARRIISDRIALPHFMAFLRNNSFRKIINLLQVYLEIKGGRTEVKSKPFILFLEVNNICNLHCPFCLVGKGNISDRKRRNMTLAEMKKSIEAIEGCLYMIQLYNWGEPLLNKDIFEFIRYAHQKGIFTMVSSNMNFVRPNVAEQVVTSGLDYFIAAIDGFSPNTYMKYRRGGDFEKAIHNLKEVIQLREKKGLKRPFIEWQYVVFKHNQHELDAARAFAHSIGINFFHPTPGYIEDPEWIPTLPEYQVELGRPESVSKCSRPWSHLNIRADGGVAACCYEFFKKDDFANAFQTPFSQFWNNQMFVEARRVLAKGLGSAPGAPKTICHRCVATGIRPSFEKLE